MLLQGLGKGWPHIRLELPLVIDATFCAGAGMIAFGAVLGKTTPTQLTWLMVGMVSDLYELGSAPHVLVTDVTRLLVLNIHPGGCLVYLCAASHCPSTAKETLVVRLYRSPGCPRRLRCSGEEGAGL
jgi:hypothetical protein